MCGLIYANNFNGGSVNKQVIDQFFNQRSRGAQGFGIFAPRLGHIVKTPKQKKILSWLRKRRASEILFHHRFPTSTENVPNACHPFDTKNFFVDENGKGNRYILAHNGVLSNAHSLKAEHDKLGITYASIQPDKKFNDSEALLWDIALYLEGKQDSVKALGTIAFICIVMNKDGNKLYFARNSGNPLIMKLEDDSLFLSSMGVGKPIEENELYQFDYATRLLTNKHVFIGRWNNTYYTPPDTLRDYTRHTVPHTNAYTPGSTADIASKRIASGDTSERYDIDDYYWDSKDQELYIKDNVLLVYVPWNKSCDDIAAKRKLEVSTKSSERDRLDYEDATREEEELESTDWARALADIEEEDVSSVIISDPITKREDDYDRQDDIKRRYKLYMDMNNGSYYDAYNRTKQDTLWLKNEFKGQLENGARNEDLDYEIQVNQTIMDMLMLDERWTSNVSVDKKYVAKKKPTTNHEAQVSLVDAITAVEDSRKAPVPGTVIQPFKEDIQSKSVKEIIQDKLASVAIKDQTMKGTA